MGKREIKFRAWIRPDGFHKGEMISQESEDDYFLISNGNGFSVVDPNEEYIKDGEFEVMQFSGLTDRNGVEIYEGDKLKFKVANSTPPDEFDGVVIYSEMSASFQVGLFNFKMLYSDSLEVIGNIHQKSERTPK